MDFDEISNQLSVIYNAWKAKVVANQADFVGFGPPLLLSVTEEYCQAETRIMVFGQETNGWEWDQNLRKEFLDYPAD